MITKHPGHIHNQHVNQTQSGYLVNAKCLWHRLTQCICHIVNIRDHIGWLIYKKDKLATKGGKSCSSDILFFFCLQKNSVTVLPWTSNSHYVISKWHQPNSSFIYLNGIPGLEEVYPWIFFLFCTMYNITIRRNFGLMYLIYFQVSYTDLCTSFKPVFPSQMCSCAPPLFPAPSAYCGSTSKRSILRLAWHGCSLCTLSHGWSPGCSCLWPWTIMWPSATLYAMLLSLLIQACQGWVPHFC